RLHRSPRLPDQRAKAGQGARRAVQAPPQFRDKSRCLVLLALAPRSQGLYLGRPKIRPRCPSDAQVEPMSVLNTPRPAWMTEDLVLLEEQASRFVATEYGPHLEKWHDDHKYPREVW